MKTGPGGSRLAQLASPWLVPLSCAAVIALASRLRYPPPDLAYAAPVALPAGAWNAGIVALIGATAIALWLSRGYLADPAARSVLVELAVYPAALAVVWAVLPPYTQWYRPGHYAAAVAVLAAFAWLMWRDRARAADWGLRWSGFAAAVRALAWPTLALLAAGLLWAQLTGQLQPRWSRMAVNVLTYPLSAVVQLLLLQVLLLRRLERISDARGAMVAGTAVVFGLAHWPNPILAFGCFLGAIFWCRTFLKFGNLPAIALSMGLLAAILGNAVPREVIDNARTGPIYIQREIDAAVREAPPLAAAPPRPVSGPASLAADPSG